MYKLRSIKKGDIVDIVAPSGFADTKEVNRAATYLRNLGLVPRFPKDLIKKDLFFANTDKRRAQILKAALTSVDSKAVWCLRGGTGAQRLLPLLKNITLKHSKLFLGLSDISIFHHLINKKNIPTIHAPVLTRMGKSSQSVKERKEVEDLIFGKKRNLEFLHLRHVNAKAKKTQIIQGPIVGGNLTVLHGLMGGGKAFYGKHKIIFLEDVNEAPYKIDRMLQGLLQSGAFEKAKAVVFGDFTGCAETKLDAKNLKEVLSRFSEQVKVPVISGIKSGHGKIQRPIIFQTKSYLYLGRRPRLLIPSCIYE